MYKVVGTETYLREISKWTKSDREAAEKTPIKITSNPHSGDPLGFRFFREHRVRGKRVYFLMYDNLKLALFIATSDKKDQQ